MSKLISVLTGIYFIVSIGFLTPAIVYHLWGLAFFPTMNKGAAIGTLIKILFFIIGGYLISKFLIENRQARMAARIRAVAPPRFKATVEVRGPHDTEYLGISISETCLVVVDLGRGVARCESLDFLQSWTIEDDGVRTSLTVSFNSYDFSTIKINIPKGMRNDLAAKLNYALQMPKVNAAAVERGIVLFEALRLESRKQQRTGQTAPLQAAPDPDN